MKDSRAYLERRHGREFTQYLGAKSSTVGRVKLYNKQAEAHLDYPLTRLELTLDPSILYEKINFPTVYYLDDLQMSFSSYKATETEQFILNALFQGCGTLDQLGRRTREKIKVLMADHVKKVEISRDQHMLAATCKLPPRSRTNPRRKEKVFRRGLGKRRHSRHNPNPCWRRTTREQMRKYKIRRVAATAGPI